MDVLHARAALLPNVQVLDLLRELDARAKSTVGTVENLRTVELETIRYLSAFTPRQSDHAITTLLRDLAPFSLTTAEKLQVVNLAPTEPVELYVIVEELEDRLGDRMDDILAIVARSLSPATPEVQPPPDEPAPVDPYEAWVHDAEDPELDDFGDGVGIQGDLDMDDDD